MKRGPCYDFKGVFLHQGAFGSSGFSGMFCIVLVSELLLYITIKPQKSILLSQGSLKSLVVLSNSYWRLSLAHSIASDWDQGSGYVF